MRSLVVLAVALAVSLTAFAAADAFQTWSQQHKAASAALTQWIDKHPDSAREIFRWDGLHPERTKAFIDWAIDNKNDDAVAFHTKHNDWPEYQTLLDKHRFALDDLAAWARKFPDDAKALMQRPRALESAGKHAKPPPVKSGQAKK
jgi:hypothetical protein